MFTTEELKNIRKELPKDAYQEVAIKVGGLSSNNVRMILTEPRRYRKDVFDAVAELLEERKNQIKAQKQRIKQAIN